MNQSVHGVEHFKGYLNAPMSITSKKIISEILLTQSHE